MAICQLCSRINYGSNQYHYHIIIVIEMIFLSIICCRVMSVDHRFHCIHKLLKKIIKSSKVTILMIISTTNYYTNLLFCDCVGFSNILRQWIGLLPGRNRYPPHMKCYFRFNCLMIHFSPIAFHYYFLIIDIL